MPATMKQLNNAVDKLKVFAYAMIKQKLQAAGMEWMESQADSYVTDDELLAAAKVVAAALEEAK
jgi:hypothetical protein